MAIIEVVKYDGPPKVLAWKYPNAELGTWTQLIVNETQEAILYKGGQAYDRFGPGRHTLETANIPFLNKIVNLPFGGRSPFTAEVWFVNQTHVLDVKWGTPTPIQIQDPKYQVFIPVSAFGHFGIKVSDARVFLTKLVGTLPSFNTDDIVKHFRGILLNRVKDDISKYLVQKKITILELNAYISEISDDLHARIQPELEKYGLELVNFYINDISIPEDDIAVGKLKDALSKRAEMDIIGFNYTQERSFDTLEGAAKNPGTSASVMGAGMGLGMGFGMGDLLKDKMSEATESAKDPVKLETVVCESCKTQNKIGTKFCSECGLSMVKTCPKCNTVVSKDQKFCNECGHSLIKQCKECKEPLPEGSKFCPHCGMKDEA